MSEYIFDVPDSNQPIAGESALYYPDERDEPMAVGEEIVRCRDCARCQKYTRYERTWPEITEYEAYWCNQFNENVNLDGFCAWGVRADA